jgi:multicomponent Na+:H+ antiporter subunit G
MMEWAIGILMISGGLFSLVASVGMLRLPDTIIRMHAATKAGAFGGGLMFLALAGFYMDLSITLRAVAAIFFLLLTAPVGAHLIGRAAYCTKVQLSERTRIDELAMVCEWCDTQSVSHPRPETGDAGQQPLP